MRVVVTGGSGFVGSNVVKVFAQRHGADVVAPSHAAVDLTDRARVHDCVAEARPDAIVHCAILNDLGRVYADRRAAWDAYVGATRNVVDAANAARAKVVLVSTDWVFDGTHHDVNMIATPSLASTCAEMLWRIIDRDLQGTFHCCGGEAIGRWRLAELAASVFGLDATLLRAGRPDHGAGVPVVPVPYDTSLDATSTATALDVTLPSVRELLVALRHELETGSLAVDAA